MPFEHELSIPAPNAQGVLMRCNPYPHQDTFDPELWPTYSLVPKGDGWWVLDIASCNLADGTYEYEFKVFPPGLDPFIVADPFAEEIVKFKGYRALLYIKNSLRFRPAFSWNDELRPDKPLQPNNKLVIYELPMRWVDAQNEVATRQVDLGTFDKAIFEHLAYIRDLGCTAIELLPIQDSPDTLNWGYGTRFFFAPDFDMGSAFELKFFIKSCHQYGIRVILDIVMNHAKGCPLRDVAYDWYFGQEKGRNPWGGDLFLYLREVRPGYFPTHIWHYDMAAFWITVYHIDGFRIDEFNGIDNWDFLREFRNRAWTVHQNTFPDRPFIVIGEDSARRPEVTQGIAAGGQVVDAIWDFDYRDEIRSLCSNTMSTQLGQPSRSDRVQGIIRGDGLIAFGNWRSMYNSITNQFEKARFSDLSQRITYITSHDVSAFNEQRLFPYFFQQAQVKAGLPLVQPTDTDSTPMLIEQVISAFALMLTTPGIPMFLAGEEFADLHDLPHEQDVKMSDPINWNRIDLPAHHQILNRVSPLIHLRTTESCLQRNEVWFFGLTNGFHPTFNENDGERVFAYARTSGNSVGQSKQVAVICNAGSNDYPTFFINWPWNAAAIVSEVGNSGSKLLQIANGVADVALRPFQTRVFQIS